MHELTLMQNIIDQIKAAADEHKASKVTGVKVILGVLSHLSSEHFKEHFINIARGTIAEKAVLQIETSQDESAPFAQSILLESIAVEED